MVTFIELIIGGAIGTLARYTLAGVVYKGFGTSFPYGTIVVNLLGCFIIGFLSTIAEQKFVLGSGVRTFLMIGFCGAFTTFSTFIFETNGLIRDGEVMRAFVNVLVSVIAGFILFRLGVLLGEVI
ncbi:MAG: fluoride efflux transporter CrcB [Endomicrobiales bacterium]|nr:fluoride efflux transporter CrcB [Endomicrobiales bacterium]